MIYVNFAIQTDNLLIYVMKIFILPLTLLLLTACSYYSGVDVSVPNKERNSHKVSISEARKTIETAMAALYPATKGESSKYIVEQFRIDNSTVTKSHPIINPTDSVPPYYVFNFNENKGYALASADDRMSPILCIVDTGSFYVDSVLTNPGQIIMLSRIETEYKMALGMPIVGSDGSVITSAQYGQLPSQALTQGEDYPSGHWTTYIADTLGLCNYMSTRWKQSGFFNALMYNSSGQKCPAGCVNIAVAQLLNFHQQDITIDGYYVDWSEVNTVKSVSNPGTALGRTILQNYLYKAAIALNASMTPDSTNINPSLVPGFLNNLGYSSGGTFAYYVFSDVKTDILDGFPALLGGHALKEVQYVMGAPVTHYYKGHSWVGDGILRVKTTHHWVGTPSRPDYNTYDYCIHCNFGWGGLHDGYYYSPTFNTNNTPFPTESLSPGTTMGSVMTKTTGTSGYYQYNLTMITGIRP